MLDLSGWKGFGERVGHHVVCRAIDELNRAVFDDIVNEMEPYVDVLCTSVVLVIFGEHNGGLIVRKESCRVELAREKLQEEGMNPQALLRCMSNGNVFTLHGGEGNDFLPFSAPRNGSPVKHECIPRNSMSVLGHTPIRISISNQALPRCSICQPQIRRALQIAKDSLDGVPMRETRVLGESRDSLNCK